jgi:uncharacterized membrane protein YuzA (DUF378 family)
VIVVTRTLHWIALILTVLGALNWGLMAFDVNAIQALFSQFPNLVKLIYALIGLAGLVLLADYFSDNRHFGSHS